MSCRVNDWRHSPASVAGSMIQENMVISPERAVAAGVFAAARRLGVGHIRQTAINGAGLGGDAVVLGLLCVLQLAEAAAFILASLALGFVLGLADGLRHQIGLSRQFFDFLLESAALGFQLDVPTHVGLDAALVAVLLHGGGIIQDEALVEHDSLVRSD